MFAIVDGQKVQVGDVVCFKSDYEQCGTILKITRNALGSTTLLLGCRNLEGFGGDYLRGAETTVELASNCWVE